MPCSDASRRLAWIQRNRKRIDSETAIGPLAAAWVDASLDGGSRHAQRLAEELASVVDEDFRMHARVHVDDSRRVVIAVDRPELVFIARARWADRVGRAVRMVGGLTTASVRFTCGDWGVRIPLPGGDGVAASGPVKRATAARGEQSFHGSGDGLKTQAPLFHPTGKGAGGSTTRTSEDS